MPDALKAYRAKRDFTVTSEPAEGGVAGVEALTFVVQKHWASRLHYDFRLELDGAMKSWAVPKGPSYDSRDKRMAVQVEDHPLAYADFEGTIPAKQYGAGKVIIWDKGTWEPLEDPRQGLAKGSLKFALHGHKLRGRWALVRMKGRGGEKQEPWLLIKEKDAYARSSEEFSLVDQMPDSVKGLVLRQDEPSDNEEKPGQQAPAPAPARRAAPKKTAARPAPDRAADKAALPATFSPELATLVDAPPPDPENWVFEVKFDGYRMLARIEDGAARLVTRNANDWTERLLPLKRELERMKLPDGWYDGEIVVHDEHGKPDFGRLQQAFDGQHAEAIEYFLFDLPYCDGRDLRALALVERRALLERLLAKRKSDRVRFSAEFAHRPDELVVAACKMGLEGVIGKRRDARYVSRRSPDWIKLKCGLRQEFVIGGFTDPKGSRTGIGALLLGTYDEDGVLRYAGNVGSGFNHASLAELARRLDALRSDRSPFAPRAVPGRKHHWVEPVLVAEVSFSEWTSAGAVRHPVFQGLREDKPARRITRERARPMDEVGRQEAEEAGNAGNAGNAGKAGKAGKAEGAGAAPGRLPATLKVTNGERVIDQASGATKLDLIRYYALVGDLMMEHLKGRPVSLVRAPEGVGGELFFQKHADVRKMPGLRLLDQALDPGHSPMLEVASVQGILSAAQWNVLEFHTQNALKGTYHKPNRMVFDLDPGQDVAWPAMREAAELLRAFLDELGLPAFLKTSGGKGLHVVVPVKGGHDWDTVKGFSQAIVRQMADTLPERFAFKSGPKNRVGKIFIDYLRNGQGATTVAAWSARVRPGLGISVPLRWEELGRIKSGAQWSVLDVHTRLDEGNAPWDGYAQAAKPLTRAMKRLGFEP